MGTGLVNGATSAKGSGHLTAQPDAASGSGWPAGGWRPGALQRQAWRDRLLPPVEQVRPGLWSIPVPWPDSGLRYIRISLARPHGVVAAAARALAQSYLELAAGPASETPAVVSG